MRLTDASIRKATATKSIKLADSGGLYVLVSSNGCKWWRLDYRFDGGYRGRSGRSHPAVPAKPTTH